MCAHDRSFDRGAMHEIPAASATARGHGHLNEFLEAAAGSAPVADIRLALAFPPPHLLTHSTVPSPSR